MSSIRILAATVLTAAALLAGAPSAGHSAQVGSAATAMTGAGPVRCCGK